MCLVHMYSVLVEVRTKPYVLHVCVIFGWGRFLYESFSFPVSLSSSNAPFSCFICLPLILYNLSSWQHCEIKHLSVSPPCLCIILRVFIFYCFVWETFLCIWNVLVIVLRHCMLVFLGLPSTDILILVLNQLKL